VADLIFADPEWFFLHPVRIIGRLISILDNLLRREEDSKWLARLKGIILSFIVVTITASFCYLIIKFTQKLNPILGWLTCIYLGYSTISVKDLRRKGNMILKSLEQNSIEKARKNLSLIVSRDTKSLDEEGIIRATIESIAENTNDGIVAPIFYLILGGPVVAMVYKSINTLDSMVGYKNKKYLHFGWFSARLDDIANFIPARICGLLITIAFLIKGNGFLSAFKTMFKDSKNHESLNSGVSESAMAGGLGIRLGGGAFYAGKFRQRPYIGEDKRNISYQLIKEALTISFLVSLLIIIIGVVFKWLIG
jgi:adenosylcobinamide-phosphate synthase